MRAMRVLRPQGPHRYVKLFFLCIGIITVTALAVHYITTHNIGNSFLVRKFSENVQVQTLPSGEIDVTVPPDKLPKTQSDRMNAPIAALLPGHWSEDPQARYSSGDAVIVPVSQRGAIITRAIGFLSHWETFRPWSKTTYSQWRRSIAPYLDPAGAADILGRTGSYQPPTICPKDTCPVGSSWQGADPTTIEIRAYDPNAGTAYLTVDGYVNYKPSLGGKAVQFERQYALLLRTLGGRWLVSRAVADTLGQG